MKKIICPVQRFAAYEEFAVFIEKARAARNVPGVAVVIVKDDKVYTKGFGVCR